MMVRRLSEISLLCIATMIVGCSASSRAVRALNIAARNVDRYGYACVSAPYVVELGDQTEFNADTVQEPSPTAPNSQTESTPETRTPATIRLPESAAKRNPSARPPLPKGLADIAAPGALHIIGGENLTTHRLLRSLGRFQRNKRNDQVLLVCPLLVSVQPGYHTQQGYAADITVKVDLARVRPENGRGENGSPQDGHVWEYLSEHYPASAPPIQAVAVLPFGGRQPLDVADRRREVLSLASELALLGLEKQADYLLNHANNLEDDRLRRIVTTAVSAHNVGGPVFGFRLEPGSASSMSRTRRGARAKESLEPTAVPALAFIFVPSERLDRPAYCHDCCPVPQDARDPYQFLVLETNTRWSPLAFAGAWRGCVAEVDRWNGIAKLERAAALIGRLPPGRHRGHLESQLASLSELMLRARVLIPLNDTRPAESICVESIQPERGWWDQHTVLTIHGCGFRDNVRAVTVGGIACAFKLVNDRTLHVEVPPWGEIRKTKKAIPDGAAAEPGLTPFESGVVVVNLPQSAFDAFDPSGEVVQDEPLKPYEAQELAELRRRNACERLAKEDERRLQSLSKRQSAVELAWARDILRADVVLAADVPVCSTVSDQVNSSGGATSGIAGSIVFDRQLVRVDDAPKPVCPPVGPPQISVRYGPEGNLVAEVTTGGDPAGIAKLLEVLKEALKHQEEISFELIAEGFKLTTEGFTEVETKQKSEN